MIRSIAASCLVATLFTACSTNAVRDNSSPQQGLAEKRKEIPWWRQLSDTSLNSDIAAAFSANPSLKEVALRIEKANASVAQAKASSLPRLNLGFGYQEGRNREVDFGPYDIAPWRSSAGLSWEIDVTGKLRAAQRSATENKTAAVWDYYSSRLLLASRIASVRMNLYRFNAEIENLNQSLSANQKTFSSLKDRSQAGLIPDSILDKQGAEEERLKRDKLDLERLRDLSVVQLRSLRGGSQPSGITKSSLPSPSIPSSSPLDQLLVTHPEVLAAEARVRSAFQLEHSARLDLLPSFQINLLASGGQKNLTERFLTWTAKTGPSLNIPIYDPARISTVRSRQAEAKIAATKYRQMIFNILEEVDTARINLASRRAQLVTAKREAQALERSRNNAREQFEAGLISQVEYLDTERLWLEAKRSQASLHQALLEAQINLIKSTGGGRI